MIEEASDSVRSTNEEPSRISNLPVVGVSPYRRGRASSPSPVVEVVDFTKSSKCDQTEQLLSNGVVAMSEASAQSSMASSTAQSERAPVVKSERVVDSSPRKRNRASSPAPVVENKQSTTTRPIFKAKQMGMDLLTASQTGFWFAAAAFIFLTLYASALVQSSREYSDDAISINIEDQDNTSVVEALKLLKAKQLQPTQPMPSDVHQVPVDQAKAQAADKAVIDEAPKVSAHAATPASPQADVPESKESHCAALDHGRNAQCESHVTWAFQDGRFEGWAPIAYSGILEIAGVHFQDASIEDFQRYFFCGGVPSMACGLPPCSCSVPPCDVCLLPTIGQVEFERKLQSEPQSKPQMEEPQVEPQIVPDVALKAPVTQSNSPVVLKDEAVPPPPLQAIGYSPVPFKHSQSLKSEDFMSEQVADFWGSHAAGRGDLAIIAQLGATAVRVREVDPGIPHKAFLDETKKQGMKAIVGLSDYPYLRMPGSCVQTHFNCFDQTFQDYSAILRSGFVDGESYHAALDTIILAEDLDSKFRGALDNPKEFSLAVITAIDAVLEVEKLFGVVKNLPLLSASVGFQKCKGCAQYSKVPALGQMAQLRASFLDPSSVSYKPRNDLRQAYKNRFVNSFSAEEASALEIRAFQTVYDKHFAGTRVFISDLHLSKAAVEEDLRLENLVTVLNLVQNTQTMLRGFSFSEFQMRHDRADSQKSSALFELGSHQIGKVDFFGQKVSSWCLSAVHDLPDVVAAAFGGSVATLNEFCSSKV